MHNECNMTLQEVWCVQQFCRMVLVPIHRLTRRLLGFIVIALALVVTCFLFEQMRHIYHQHLKFRRLQNYRQYVDDVTKDMAKLESLANKSSFSVDQLFIMLGQPLPTKDSSLNLSHDSNNVNDSRINRWQLLWWLCIQTEAAKFFLNLSQKNMLKLKNKNKVKMFTYPRVIIVENKNWHNYWRYVTLFIWYIYYNI